jgi:hypothetical protein
MNLPKTSLLGFLLAALPVFIALSTTAVYARDTLNPGETLKRGEYLTSENQQYTFVLEREGNLILYAGKRPIWASNTNGQRVQRLHMQPDGNLVLYLGDNQPIWATNTVDKPGSFLILQNDGNLVIYQPYPVWASNTERGQRDERRGRWRGLYNGRDLDGREDRGR